MEEELPIGYSHKIGTFWLADILDNPVRMMVLDVRVKQNGEEYFTVNNAFIGRMSLEFPSNWQASYDYRPTYLAAVAEMDKRQPAKL